MMVRIVSFQGGLGNQMFIFAFYYSLLKKFKYSFVEMDVEETYFQHNGFELFRIFALSNHGTSIYYRRIKNLRTKYLTKYLVKVITENDWLKASTGSTLFYPLVFYRGFWQSEKYFEYIKSDIRRLFTFDKSMLNWRTISIQSEMEECSSVSIHIRRGDYLHNNELRNICTVDYYMVALDEINRRIERPVYFVFTDDPDWVRINFGFLDYKLIDWNIKENSWQDMYLMSKCRHNIIANSTFSWWGAWLNISPDKIVIAPKKWFNTYKENEIVPNDWLRF